MLHTAGTEIAANDCWNVLWVVHLVLNILSPGSIVSSTVIACATSEGCSSNSVSTIVYQYGIPCTCSLSISRPVLYLTRIDDDVVESLVHTTVLARESAIALGVGTLLRAEHRILHITEVVGLNEC